MERKDKVVMVGAIVVAAFLLYMIKPAPVNAFCSDWNDSIFDRFTSLDKKFTYESEELGNEWMNLQRESLIYDTACSDITMFF